MSEAVTTTYNADLIDTLIDALNAGVTDVTFSRDVLETNRPEAWGAVELTGDDNPDWGDGSMVDQEVCADLWVCTPDRGSQIKRRVQKVLKEFAATYDIGWRFKRRNYLYDLDKVMYQWTLWMFCPLGEDPEDETLEDPEWPEMDQDEPAVPADESEA